jgi:hypothetical protein
MKSIGNRVFVTLTRSEIENLTRQVKETLAPNIIVSTKEKVFTSADLWSIQRLTKPRMSRRFL